MKPKTIGVILDAFLDKFNSDQIENDIEIRELFQRLKLKFDVYTAHWTFIPQGETLRLMQKHLPEVL